MDLHPAPGTLQARPELARPSGPLDLQQPARSLPGGRPLPL